MGHQISSLEEKSSLVTAGQGKHLLCCGVKVQWSRKGDRSGTKYSGLSLGSDTSGEQVTPSDLSLFSET